MSRNIVPWGVQERWEGPDGGFGRHNEEALRTTE